MKTILYLTAAVLLAAAFIGYKSIRNQQAEKVDLEVLQAEVVRLEAENAQIEALRMTNQEVQRLQEETGDLPKLRNEVRQLRDKVKHLPALRQENESLRARHADAQQRAASPNPAANPIVEISLDQLAFAGFGSPEATLQSAFWAMRENNMTVLSQSLTENAPNRDRVENKELVQIMSEKMKSHLAAVKILGKKQVSPDEVILVVQMNQIKGGDSGPGAISLKRIGHEWKLTSAP